MISLNQTKFSVAVITMFPEIFPGSLNYSLPKEAQEKNIDLEVFNLRDFAHNKHRKIDHKPYGGGAGLIMLPEVLSCIDYVLSIYRSAKIMCPSPRGIVIDQNKINQLKDECNLIILCGRFEGIDQRIIDEYNIEEVSIGDFVLLGGEVVALTIIEACIRLIPGVISNDKSLREESFGMGSYSNLLEYPQYTKPKIWRNREVPNILMSGNHQEIKKWQLNKAEEITKTKRQDMWYKYRDQNKNTSVFCNYNILKLINKIYRGIYEYNRAV